MGIGNLLKSRQHRHRVDMAKGSGGSVSELPTSEYIDLAYEVILGRKVDPEGLRFHSEAIDSGRKSRGQLVYELTLSTEFRSVRPELAGLDDRDFVSLMYELLLFRKADSSEVENNASNLAGGKITRGHLLHTLFRSQEFRRKNWRELDFWFTIHEGREVTAAQLPKANRIVDLGGSCEGNPEGAMIVFGYPYHFESLTIVELPREARHELYTEICGEYDQVVRTKQGPVNYVYASMTDLSAIADDSIDLVYAGQSIEHVTCAEANQVIQEVRRVLRRGGHFCFDTPNRNVTQYGFPNFIVDDHKYEYTHQEMKEILERNGFEIQEAKGITLMDQTVREKRFIPEEAFGRDRLYDDIEESFLLYYKARKI